MHDLLTCHHCPIPNSQFPIPNSQFPILNSQFPIPHSPFPIPNKAQTTKVLIINP
ncbi:MAG: hypothetical protein F6K31_31485 [Symploca sp. SIO2G7]|nr:hypothetical protein [Symploca sp. SIO2G7]